MAFMRVAFFPGADASHYRALEVALGDAPSPSERLVFAAGVSSEGLRVVQVWESRAALESFNETWFLPALARAGSSAFPCPPEVSDSETIALHPRPSTGGAS